MTFRPQSKTLHEAESELSVTVFEPVNAGGPTFADVTKPSGVYLETWLDALDPDWLRPPTEES